MNKDQIIKLAAETAVKATLEALDRERRKADKYRKDKRLHNTKILLKHYNLFKDHCNNAVGSLQQLTGDTVENAIDILASLENKSTDIYIESIKRSVARTYTIVSHIDAMLGLYESYCYRSNKPEDARKYRTVIAHYINEKAIEDIATEEGVEKRTCYRDIRDAQEKLSALIFGIDGLAVMSQSCHLHSNMADAKM